MYWVALLLALLCRRRSGSRRSVAAIAPLPSRAFEPLRGHPACKGFEDGANYPAEGTGKRWCSCCTSAGNTTVDHSTASSRKYSGGNLASPHAGPPAYPASQPSHRRSRRSGGVTPDGYVGSNAGSSPGPDKAVTGRSPDRPHTNVPVEQPSPSITGRSRRGWRRVFVQRAHPGGRPIRRCGGRRRPWGWSTVRGVPRRSWVWRLGRGRGRRRW